MIVALWNRISRIHDLRFESRIVNHHFPIHDFGLSDRVGGLTCLDYGRAPCSTHDFCTFENRKERSVSSQPFVVLSSWLAFDHIINIRNASTTTLALATTRNRWDWRDVTRSCCFVLVLSVRCCKRPSTERRDVGTWLISLYGS